MLLSPLEMLLHTRTGGEVAKFWREKGCPLPCRTLFPSPIPLLPLWAKPLYLGHEGDAQRVQGTHRSLGGHCGAKAGFTCAS